MVHFFLYNAVQDQPYITVRKPPTKPFQKKTQMRCHKKQIRSHFSNYNNQRGLNIYEKTLIDCGTDILKVGAISVFGDTSYFC